MKMTRRTIGAGGAASSRSSEKIYVPGSLSSCSIIIDVARRRVCDGVCDGVRTVRGSCRSSEQDVAAPEPSAATAKSSARAAPPGATSTSAGSASSRLHTARRSATSPSASSPRSAVAALSSARGRAARAQRNRSSTVGRAAAARDLGERECRALLLAHAAARAQARDRADEVGARGRRRLVVAVGVVVVGWRDERERREAELAAAQRGRGVGCRRPRAPRESVGAAPPRGCGGRRRRAWRVADALGVLRKFKNVCKKR